MADNFDKILAGLSTAADVYLKTKALDLAEQQSITQMQEATFQRQRQEKQLALTEKKIESDQSLANLNILLKNHDNIREERRNQQKVLEQTYKVAPEFKTKASQEISDVLSGSMSDSLNQVQNLIQGEQNKLDDLSTQISGLRAQEAWYREEAPKYVGLNKILQEHEYGQMIEQAKKLDQFKGIDDFAGMRKAYGEEFSPRDRAYMTQYMTDKLSAGSKAVAVSQYQTLQAFTQNEEFDWEAQFGSETLGADAKAVLGTNDYKNFLTNLNSPGNEQLRRVFETNPALRSSLQTIEGHASKVYELERENLGIDAPNPIDDFETALATFNIGEADKDAVFEFYHQYVQSRGLGTDQETMNRLFEDVESLYNGQDLQEDFTRWLMRKKPQETITTTIEENDKTEEPVVKNRRGVIESPTEIKLDGETVLNALKSLGELIPEYKSTGLETRSQIDNIIQKQILEQEKLDKDTEASIINTERNKRMQELKDLNTKFQEIEAEELFGEEPEGWGRNPFEEAPEDWETSTFPLPLQTDYTPMQLESLDRLLMQNDFSEISQDVMDLEGWGRNPFLPSED